jgi:adenine deaminase
METNKAYAIRGVVVDVEARKQYGAVVYVEDGIITAIEPKPGITYPIIIPGFIDAHVHIESSMLIPSRFAPMALRHGTVGVVTDPHEVANVAGKEGIDFMTEDGKMMPLQFFFGVPSCVPASPLEKSGAIINSSDVKAMLAEDRFYYLSEMMNFPGVLNQEEEVMRKLELARAHQKPVDGHAPGLQGAELEQYVNAGISTDHECSTLEEALEKIRLGMKILIREGSAARNFDTLIPLLKDYPDHLMFCTDDCHPDFLLDGHINKLVSRSVKLGYDVYDALKVACINPVKHYRLPVGQLKEGDQADFTIVHDLVDFNADTVFIHGVPVINNGICNLTLPLKEKPDYVFRNSHQRGKLETIASGNIVNVIGAIDGELYTEHLTLECKAGEVLVPDLANDIIKLVLLDRYSDSDPVVAFIKGLGLKRGAFGCSVAHDSHHIIAAGCDDQSLDKVLMQIVQNRGGLCVADESMLEELQLPFFGLMTDLPGEEVAGNYHRLNKWVKSMGSHLQSPFMTLSFMALTVIPRLKINHSGVFDGNLFRNIPLFTDQEDHSASGSSH